MQGKRIYCGLVNSILGGVELVDAQHMFQHADAMNAVKKRHPVNYCLLRADGCQ